MNTVCYSEDSLGLQLSLCPLFSHSISSSSFSLLNVWTTTESSSKTSFTGERRRNNFKLLNTLSPLFAVLLSTFPCDCIRCGINYFFWHISTESICFCSDGKKNPSVHFIKIVLTNLAEWKCNKNIYLVGFSIFIKRILDNTKIIVIDLKCLLVVSEGSINQCNKCSCHE